MESQDLRLVEVRQREGMSFGLNETVLTVVAVSILIFIGLLVVVKVRGQIDKSSFTAADNATFDNINSNATGALDLTSLGVYVLGAVVIIGFFMAAFR